MSNQTARGPTDYNLVRLTVAFGAMEICQNKNSKNQRHASVLRKKNQIGSFLFLLLCTETHY